MGFRIKIQVWIKNDFIDYKEISYKVKKITNKKIPNLYYKK